MRHASFALKFAGACTLMLIGLGLCGIQRAAQWVDDKTDAMIYAVARRADRIMRTIR
jgi:predicted nuclease of predicted toxin-antitoxin system